MKPTVPTAGKSSMHGPHTAVAASANPIDSISWTKVAEIDISAPDKENLPEFQYITIKAATAARKGTTLRPP